MTSSRSDAAVDPYPIHQSDVTLYIVYITTLTSGEIPGEDVEDHGKCCLHKTDKMHCQCEIDELFV